MFADPANRQRGSSLLLAANSNDARVANSTSPWAPNPPNQQPPPHPHPHHPHSYPHQPQPHPHPHQQHGQQVSNPTAYMRPPPTPIFQYK